MELRYFQSDLKTQREVAVRDDMKNVLMVSPTGSGKTVLMASITQDLGENVCIIAHRKELVGQISMALATMGVEHNIIGSDATISFCISKHIGRFGKSLVNPKAFITVASVDTLNARAKGLIQWASTVRTVMIDEAHHVLPGNKWGKAVASFPNAGVTGYTASPIRCDGKSLSSVHGGVFDHMCVGPSPRLLINEGYLADYRIFAPPQSFSVSELKVSKSTGEFDQKHLRATSAKSTITGDVVEQYKRIAPGKRGITFAVDVESADRIAATFRASDVPAVAISGNTADSVRDRAIEQFERGEILQLVNVDLFGEGFDVPAVEVVSMARPTKSFGLYLQQFGRALRTSEGKDFGIIIDHVGNVKEHGLPDAVRSWDLHAEPGRRRMKRDPDVMPVTTCLECFRAYERIHSSCPYCGHVPVPAGRSAPEMVDGDLHEMSPELMSQLRGEIERIDGEPVVPFSADSRTQGAVRRNWRNRQVAQAELRDVISTWAGVRKYREGDTDAMIYRRFFHRFGVDIMSAQTLNKNDAEKLIIEIRKST